MIFFQNVVFIISLLCCSHTPLVPILPDQPITTQRNVYSLNFPDSGTIRIVTQSKGPVLGYSVKSGVTILTVDNLKFKDLNKNGKIDQYEDWRLSPTERAKDLSTKLSIEQIAGLMLYSRHQAIPAGGRGFMAGTYNGKPFNESGEKPSALSDQQIAFLTNDNVRHVLITSVQNASVAAEWNNNAQELVEGIGFGIPANNSSDPRHGTIANAEFNAGAGGKISMWPSSLGLAATFDPTLVQHFGQIAATEYRALGIATALSPQVDLATDPRWNRFSGTFGEDAVLAADLARAYIDGFQTSTGNLIVGNKVAGRNEIQNGWGYTSVNAMVKHWPGGGSGEAGRDAHYGFGKYAVYPGNQFENHFYPFTNGAFKLKGKTKMAAAVMPYYTISHNQDKKNRENVGNSYNAYIINDLLRTKYQYDGVVCTDWNITSNATAIDVFITGKPWGVENLTVAERHYKALMAGIDQFGGNNEAAPVLEAYRIGVTKSGEQAMRARFEQSAVRLLRNIIQLGLFENPYLTPEVSARIVGKPEFMTAGYEAQKKSIVLLKNKKQVLPLKRDITVYIPKRFTPAGKNFLGMDIPEKLDFPVNMDLVKRYFRVTDNPTEADVALVFVAGPDSGNGYSSEDALGGGNGYVPISLQYGPYKAVNARSESIAGGDPKEMFVNRTYKNKTIKAINHSDLDMITKTHEQMNGKPVIVSMQLSNPAVVSEFEKMADGILLTFGVQDQAQLDILSGAQEPSGLLPLQMPANMETVESQKEDVAHDMQVHVDESGNRYDFAFGLNWKGVINDARVKKYKGKRSF